MLKVILVGRHEGQLPDVEIVFQRNMVWSTNFEEAADQWRQLMKDAKAYGACVVYQNTPAILTSVLIAASSDGGLTGVRQGVIVSKVGDRRAAVTKVFEFSTREDRKEAEYAVTFANGRAKVDYPSMRGAEALSVTVDPVTPFEFSHIQWL